jgi:gluconokinase
MQYPATHLVVMGVAGSGKSTLAAALSRQLGLGLCRGGRVPPPGQHRQDERRAFPCRTWTGGPGCRKSRIGCQSSAAAGTSTVLTCSALKQSVPPAPFRSGRPCAVYPPRRRSADLIGQRMQGREGHFMPPTLLPSQLATLEQLSDEAERADGSLRLDISNSPEVIVAAVVTTLNLPALKLPAEPRR